MDSESAGGGPLIGGLTPGGGIACNGTGYNTGGGRIDNTGGTTGRRSEDSTPTEGSE